MINGKFIVDVTHSFIKKKVRYDTCYLKTINHIVSIKFYICVKKDEYVLETVEINKIT